MKAIQKKNPDHVAFRCDERVVFVEAAAAEGAKKLPTFEMVAYTGAAMNVGWGSQVIIDLNGLVLGQRLPIRRNHDRDRLVGHSTSVELKSGKLAVAGVISFENDDAIDIVTSAKNEFPWQASVGASADLVEFLPAGKTATVNGRQVSGPLNILRKATLKEISFVDLGADGATSATVAANAKENAMDEDEVKGGQGPGSDQQEKKLTAGEGGGGGAPTAVRGSDPDAVLASARQERDRQERVTAIIEAAVQRNPALLDSTELNKIAARAIKDRLDPLDVELAVAKASELAAIQANRPRGPHVQVRAGGPPSDIELAASVLLACGVPDVDLAKDRDFGEKVVERAWKSRSMGLHALMATALQAHGVQPPHGGDALFRATIEQGLRAGFSEVNLPGILGSVGNKLLLRSFTSVNATYPRIAQQADFSNFLTYTSYRLDHTGEFAKVASNGELKHGKLAESAYTNRLETRGTMLSLPRQAIVNDDMNALVQIYAMLGRKASIAVERALYEELMESSDSFFAVGNNNRLTSNALGVSGLGTAEAAMLMQLGTDSEPIYAQPKILLVPPALKYLADQLYVSATLGAGSAGAPTDNPFRGRFQVETSPYLSLATMDGASATTWYMLADPELMPALQVAYLQGRRAPTIETADTVFNTLGIQFRCFFDYGVAKMDYRGANKNTA